MRKFLYIFLVLVFVFCLALPCFATGTGYRYYSPIMFDGFYTGSTYQHSDSWAANIIGSSTSSHAADLDYYSYQLAAIDTRVYQMDVYTASSFLLSGSDQILLPSLVESWYCTFGVEYEAAGTIDYSLQLVLLEGGSEKDEFGRYIGDYNEVLIPISGTFTVDVGENFALGTALMREIERYTSLSLVRVRSISFTFKTSSDYLVDDVQPSYRFQFNVDPYGGNGYWSKWWNQFDLACAFYFEADSSSNVDLEDVSFLDWLMGSAQAFFSTPLFGDFSFGGLLAVVIAIGLIGVLIKVLT